MKIFRINNREYFESRVKSVYQNGKVFFMKNNSVFDIEINKKMENQLFSEDVFDFVVFEDQMFLALNECNKIKQIGIKDSELNKEISVRALGKEMRDLYIREFESTYIYSIDEKVETYLPISNIDILCKDQEFFYCYSEGKILKLKEAHKDDENKVTTILENTIDGKIINGREIKLDKIFFEMDINDRNLFLTGGVFSNPVNKKNNSYLWKMSKDGKELVKIYNGEVFNINVHGEYVYFIDRKLGMSLCRVDFQGNEFEIIENGLCCDYSIENEQIFLVKYDKPAEIKVLQEELYNLQEKYMEHLFDSNIIDEDLSIRISIEKDIEIRSNKIRKFFKDDIHYEYKIKNIDK